jgi:hypothetical protein
MATAVTSTRCEVRYNVTVTVHPKPERELVSVGEWPLHIVVINQCFINKSVIQIQGGPLGNLEGRLNRIFSILVA